MAQFRPATRGDSSPQGKPRVFFCAHPRDFGLLDGIAEEILSRQNCAVWYDTEPEAPYDEELFFAYLKLMNLFVMPVTTGLLTTPNRARDVEFPFAVKNNIPVLPLMQERGLEELFNRVCGDLQFLTKLDPDPTAIPYEEKLTRYLNSVLIGDELAARVRAAFDAHIFLSYRKKDRALAQELMQLIHKNDFCRDVAIWYDEFLTPGENFNEAIERALKECDLFALAVTPNLVNEKNYVMTVEYPMAKEAHRKILPVVMRKVSQWRLRLRYKKIPQKINAHDTEALAKALADALDGVAKRENDNDPAHNYLIGLAYLNGIDVEVDRERAVILITGAAEAGIPEAMKKLVSMYREGEGVERNYGTAIEWQRKLVEWWRETYEQNPSEGNGLVLFSELWDLGDYIYELRQLDGAEAVYADMMILAEELNETHPSTRTRRDLSVSLAKLGNIRRARGDLDGAEDCFARFLEIAEALTNETHTVEARRDLAISLNNLGDIRQARGDLDGAEDCFAHSLEIFEALANETHTAEAQRDLAVSLDKIGDIHRAREDLDGAENYFARSLEILESLATETHTVEARRDLSVSLEKIGDIRRIRRDMNGAEDCFARSLEIREALANETHTVEARRDLAISLNNLGNILRARRNLDGAEDCFARFLEIAEALTNETHTVEARRDLAISLNKLGDIRQARGDLDGAEDCFARSLEIREVLARQTHTVESYDDLAVSYVNLATLREPYDHELLQKALRICTVLAEQCPGVARYRQNRDSLQDLLNSMN